MSTIKAMRKPSKIQFIETMYLLVDKTWKNLKKFPKSTVSIQNEIRQLIDDAEDCVIIANKIGILTQTSLDEKRMMFEKSLGYLDAFDCKMSRFIDHYGHGKNDDDQFIMKEGSIKELARLIDEETSLLKQVLKKLPKELGP